MAAQLDEKEGPNTINYDNINDWLRANDLSDLIEKFGEAKLKLKDILQCDPNDIRYKIYI